MKKLLFCFVLIFSMLLGKGLGYAQTIPNPVVVFAPDSIKLQGKGDFGGTDSDQGKTYYYNLNVGDSYKFICRVNSHTGATTRGKVIAFLKDVNPFNETAGNRPMHFVSAEVGQIAFYSRISTGSRTRKLASVAVSGYPSWLYIEKKGDSVITKYSLNSANTPINSISWANVARYGNAFSGWQNVKKGVGVCSGSSSYSTTIVSKFTLQPSGGNVNPTIIQGISDNQIIAYWNVSGVLKPVKARIFSGKLWATTANTVLDDYFFVRGGNFLSRQDVTLQNSFSSTKIQYFEGTTASNGLTQPPTFTTPSGYQLGTNTSISSDGSPYYEPVHSLPNCAGNLFAILSATQQTGLAKGEYIFNATNASKHKWSLYYGTTFVASDTITATSSRIVFNIPSTVQSNNYTLKVDIQNCYASDVRAFSYTKPDGGIISAPTIASNPNPATAGSNIALTSANCSFTVDWYKNGAFQASGQSFAVNNAVLNDVYAAKCKSGANASSFSNEIVVVDVATQGGGQTAFVNILKTVGVETQTDKFSPTPFAGIATPLKNWDGTRQFPKYPIIWHSKLDNFITANKKVWNLGISFPTDIKPNFGNQSGDGVRCVDYILYADPNTGVPYSGGIDPVCNQNINTFISARPFYNRVKSEGGTTIENTFTNERLYDEGIQYTRSDLFGYGDNVGLKTNTGISITDVENGEHGRFEEIPIVIGMANNTFGVALSMYNQSINIAFPELSHYPLNYVTGGYSATKVLLDGTPTSTENNVINDAWKPESKVTISTRGINNKGLIDFPNAWESSEVSSYASAAYFQGDVINYDGTNTRITNKFGINRNAEHVVAHTIYGVQVRKWHLRKYFNDRGFFTLAKTLCDRGNVGLTTFNTGATYVTNPALSGKHLPRKLAFIKTMFVPFEGGYFYHWDRNTEGKIIDGDNGELFAFNLLHQKKSLSQGNYSFVDLFDTFDFKLWTAEISYDGGITWKQEKGTDYIMSQTSIPHAQCITNNGIWAVLLARPENTEVKSCRLRIMYGGSYKYLDITPSMWETTNPAYANTILSNIPDREKDYFYDLIDVSGGSITQGTTATPPVITSSVSAPTANQSVTLSSNGCQSSAYTNKWYDSAEGNLLASGNTYTVNAQNGAGYFAKCVSSTLSSLASNVITFNILSPSGGVTITEPSNPPYYFSDNHAPSYYNNRANLPAVITNQATFDPVNDVVYLENSFLKFGFNLKRGGQICYASEAGSTENRVYNGNDGGFQWQLDATQYLVGGQLAGQTSGSPQNNVNYNTTQGGDFNNHSQTLIDYHAVTNGYYFKFRPIMYNFNAVISDVEIEVTYTLVGSALKIEYKYVSFRGDGFVETNNAFRFMGWAIPICFLTNNFTKYQAYTGSSPWANGNILTDGDIPNCTNNQNPPVGLNSTEFWGMAYDPSTNFAVGVYNGSEGGTQANIQWEQLNKYSGSSAGTVFTGPYTTMSMLLSVVIPDGTNYTKNMTAYITMGQKSLIQGRFKTISGN